MPRADMAPVRMQRVAVVAPREVLRQTLVRLAEAGCVEIDHPDDRGHGGAPGSAAHRLRRSHGARPDALEQVSAALSVGTPDLDALERAGRTDLLAGEAELEERMDRAVRRGTCVALAGWCPASEVRSTARRLAGAGGALVPLRRPRGVEPPTLLASHGALHRSCGPLLRTYGTVPYEDLDPSLPAGIVYVVMFGMMFGDVGQGALLLLAGVALRLGRPRRLPALHPLWPLVAGAGLASVVAGSAYGEFFGPTGLFPVLWLDPLTDPLRLLASTVVVGAGLLSLAYGAGIVNRWREGGAVNALYATSGIAGAVLFLGIAVLAGAAQLGQAGYAIAGAAIVFTGLLLTVTGLFAATGGGVGGAAQAAVRLIEGLVRTVSNTVSFARLAAFGLTHAALGDIVWRGTTALADRGGAAWAAAVVVLVAGNALAFAISALVAGVQALRLEYYELFSRVFEDQGRPFRPWDLPVRHTEVAT
ncbi:V-type ATPase 116kDa subunit family protein [Streptomyces meridianus]|uniref:ATPase n=1 Tax=Streptomyces meridianus TaxID=2938945 RepID=A0ABT0XDB2_9ACTN|nr:V-type ATPase 116kDa subunit family protein [Streptomyces meridianus]MCM2579754.1 ATPase [Streptomyces meridianus]